jgi:hypothetical protein
MGQRLTNPALIGLRNAAYRVLPPSLTIGALGAVTNWRAPGLS